MHAHQCAGKKQAQEKEAFEKFAKKLAPGEVCAASSLRCNRDRGKCNQGARSLQGEENSGSEPYFFESLLASINGSRLADVHMPIAITLGDRPHQSQHVGVVINDVILLGILSIGKTPVIDRMLCNCNEAY